MIGTPHDNAQNRLTYPGEGTLVGGSSAATGPRGPRWLRLVTIAAVTAVAAVVVFGAYWRVRLVTNVDSFDLNAGGERPEGMANDRTDRLQILVLGSDTRSGPNSDHGPEDSEGYGQSDVMMLVDISEDNDRVNVLSFPRDLLVDVPACTDGRSGQTFGARPGAMINSAMRDAGPGCAVDTVNALTGLDVDHFMLADFHAVTELSLAVGGVDVCVSAAIDEPKSGLRLPAGTSSVEGEQALAFLRARAAFADGGDLGRIQAQQAFLGSLTRKITDEGTLRNPQRILRIADAVTSNLTVDSGLASVSAMVTIADRLKDIDPGNVAFIAVPTVPAEDPNRLQLDAGSAAALFAVLQESADLSTPASPDPAESGAGSEGQEDASASEDLGPIPVPVVVADGTAGTGRGSTVVESLRSAGFAGATTVPAAAVELTAVYYGEGFADSAADIAAALGIPPLAVSADPSIYGVEVYLGADAEDGFEPAAPDVTGSINQTADEVSCQEVNPFG